MLPLHQDLEHQQTLRGAQEKRYFTQTDLAQCSLIIRTFGAKLVNIEGEKARFEVNRSSARRLFFGSILAKIAIALGLKLSHLCNKILKKSASKTFPQGQQVVKLLKFQIRENTQEIIRKATILCGKELIPKTFLKLFSALTCLGYLWFMRNAFNSGKGT